ncbi:hypothetical protein LA080_015575 [Diaporthe eres]|nr:hypothetical protein LA080_015575 [Diaporthe eres]
MKSTPEEIEAALANYRKVTAERNKRDLQIFVDAIVNADFEDEQVRDEFTDEQMHKERMGQLGELVQDDLDHLSQPTELMERYDELAATYFKALEAALRERAPEEVKETISVPEEFRVLARHITGICGPGLPKNHTERGITFSCVGAFDEISSRMLTPEETRADLVIDERIALGWNPGHATYCEWKCVYAQQADGSWAWEFLFFDDFDARAFDNISELLEYLLEMSDDEPPVLEGVTAEDVIERAVWGLRD